MIPTRLNIHERCENVVEGGKFNGIVYRPASSLIRDHARLLGTEFTDKRHEKWRKQCCNGDEDEFCLRHSPLDEKLTSSSDLGKHSEWGRLERPEE